MKPVCHFDIHYNQFINEQGSLTQPLPDWATKDVLVAAYQDMVRTRVFDQKAIALQRTGQLGTYPSTLGMEAIGVGIGLALDKDDVFVPYYRDHATLLKRGYRMEDILLYWGGDERGSLAGQPQDFPYCVPIATQCGHAVGAAAAKKIRGESNAVLVTIGDGGTSKGDFLESVNVAGVWQLPVVFVINNNQWAISVPRNIQTGSKTLAQKAILGGVPSVQVDGNDLVAVYEAVREALKRAYHHKGATVIECISYRLSDHTTADDATRYRRAEEVSNAWEKEPVKRLQQYLHQQGAWNEHKEQALLKQAQQAVESSVKAYLSTPPEPPEAMFDHLYAQMPQGMEEQLEALSSKVQRMTAAGKGGNSHG
jgi:2-oxoisovalerate dehydrogenase E1 component alpha subunit